jgi:tetratricopeptide (TPR) repeat protein
VRIGIATGLVVVGDLIGEGAAQEQGVVGETPNVAARLQALAEPGQVVISQGTRRLTGGMFEYHNLGRVTLKGLSDPVRAWQVVGVSAVQSRFEAQHEAVLTPLVGREEELDLLMRRWRQATSGEGRVVLLSGEPGIGKSRLTVALSERLQEEPHTRVRYFCSPHHTDSALYPTINQLERAAGFERDDTPEAKLDKMGSLLGPSSGHDDQLLSELLSLPTGKRYAPLNWSPQRKKEKTFDALLRQLQMLSCQRPLLLVYEDVHWIDPSSRELLDMTVDRVASLPVLLIITFRPEFQPPWTGQAHVSVLSLSRLGRRERAALVEQVAGNNALPYEIMAEIVERTDGIPLFVEELTKAVLEAGPHDEDTARSVSTAPRPTLAVPAALHASLMARLDRLGPVAKEIAQIGAAIGREFSYEPLAPVAQKSGADLQAALGQLSDAGLLFCRGTPPQATFLFKHALVRDAAYGMLLRGKRQELHARIAQALMERFPEIAPEVVAHHLTEAGAFAAASGYWARAGERASRRAAYIEAINHLGRGLKAIQRLPTTREKTRCELELHLALGEAYRAKLGLTAPELAQTYRRAIDLAEELGDRHLQAAAVHGYAGLVCFNSGRLQEAERVAGSFLDALPTTAEPSMRMHLAHALGCAIYQQGRLAAGRSYLEEAREHFRSAKRPTGGDALEYDLFAAVNNPGHLARVYWLLGCIGKSTAAQEHAMRRARDIGHPFFVAFALNHWLTICAFGRDYRAMEPLARELGALAEQNGFPFFAPFSAVFSGCALVAEGRSADGLSMMQQGIDAQRRSGLHVNRVLIISAFADCLQRVGEVDAGLAAVQRGFDVAEVGEVQYMRAEFLRIKGELLRGPGERKAAASQALLEAIEMARLQGSRCFELRASTSLARLWRDQGKRTEAHDLLAPIYGWFTEGFDTPDLKEAKALLDQLA